MTQNCKRNNLNISGYLYYSILIGETKSTWWKSEHYNLLENKKKKHMYMNSNWWEETAQGYKRGVSLADYKSRRELAWRWAPCSSLARRRRWLIHCAIIQLGIFFSGLGFPQTNHFFCCPLPTRCRGPDRRSHRSIRVTTWYLFAVIQGVQNQYFRFWPMISSRSSVTQLS